MSMNLHKGEQINLSKEAPNLKKARIDMGWNINKKDRYAFELDISLFMLGENGKIPHEKYFVFYNHLESMDGSVKFMEYNEPQDGCGDTKTIEVDLIKVNPVVQEIIFIGTIYDVEGKNPTLGQIENLFIRIYDNDLKEQIAKYKLDNNFSTETAVEFGRLYKNNAEWSFQAIGQGYNSELINFVDKYVS